MEIQANDKIEIDGIVIGPGMTEEQAKKLLAKGQETALFVMMTMAKMLAVQAATSSDAPSTPSGAKPVYTKPNKQDQPRGRKKKGAKVGHEGAHRAPPVEIDRRETRRAKACPDCGCKRLRRRSKTRKRIVIDMPEGYTSEAVEYTIHADYCPKCKKEVEPKIPEALPGSTLGNRIVAFTAWLHYCLNMTIGQLVSVFEFHIKSTISRGGLVKMWHRLAAIFEPWYDQIEEDAKSSAVLHGDETGWRVDGKTHWLWCFASEDTTYYMVHESRGSPAIAEFFKEFYDGVLVTDFWAAYNRVACADRQMCLVHLLRELKKVDQYLDTSDDWQTFRKKLKRLIQDAIRLCHRRDELSVEKYASLKQRIEARLDKMLSNDWANKNATRLVKRLQKYRPHIFTFLENASVPYENNFAEREVRPAVLHRKNSYGNRSVDGSHTQSVLTSLFRTLKQRNLNPIDTIVKSLREYSQTSKLPPLPRPKT